MNLIKKYTSIVFSVLLVFSSVVSLPIEAAKDFSYKVVSKSKKTAILKKFSPNVSVALEDPIDGYSIIEVASNASSFKQIKDRHIKKRLKHLAIAIPTFPLLIGMFYLSAEKVSKDFETDISYILPQITSVDLPNCKKVGENSFLFCNRIGTINLPKCENLARNSLYGCTSVNSLNIPQCKLIDDPFNANENFNNIRLLKVKGMKAIRYCDYSSFEKLNAPNCTEVTEGSFYNFKRLREVNLQSCKKIGARAFYNCESLKTIDLPECTKMLSYNDKESSLKGAFGNCENLESINIPNLIFADSGCFKNCKALKNIDLNKCKKIKESCCENCISMTTALLDASTKIENYAFKGCNSLEDVRMPNVVSIGEGAFYNTALKRLDLPNCSSIDKVAFNDCKKLTVVNSTNLTSIGESAFEGCENLEEVELPHCKLIGKNAFKDCYKLKKITIPKSCKVEENSLLYKLVVDGKLKIIKV